MARSSGHPSDSMQARVSPSTRLLLIKFWFQFENLFQSQVALLEMMSPVILLNRSHALAFVQVIQRSQQSSGSGKGAANDQKRKGRLDRHVILFKMKKEEVELVKESKRKMAPQQQEAF